MTDTRKSLSDALPFAHGPAMPNRFMLAPLTNMQSHADGTLSEDEIHWLTLRAQGGFGLTMTAAAHVQACGQGFAGQLGIWSDAHLPGLERMATRLNACGGLSAVQLHHAGRRANTQASGQPMRCPWDDAETGASALSTGEVEQLIEDFILAALRAERAGFHGVELHGAHGYILGQFLDADHNHRHDRFGGSFENRCRVLQDIVSGIRQRTQPGFQLGVRLSPERFGTSIPEARALAQSLMLSGHLDYLDMSMWDVFKAPDAVEHQGKALIDHFTDLPRGKTLLGVAGKIMDTATAQRCLDRGVDFVLIGRGAMLHHDFARRALADPAFCCIERPVTRAYMEAQGLNPTFIGYVTSTWTDFIVG